MYGFLDKPLNHVFLIVCAGYPSGYQKLTLPNDNILDLSKFKAFANDKLKVIQMAKFVLGKIENIVGKEENAGYQHFLLFPQCFQKALLIFIQFTQ